MKNRTASLNFFLSLLFFSTSLTAIAQSSDRLQYYIAFDRSGSVEYLDDHDNLQTVLKLLLKISGDSLNTNVDVKTFTFGEYTVAKKIADYSAIRRTSKNNTRGLARRLHQETLKDTRQNYTHIHYDVRRQKVYPQQFVFLDQFEV